MGLGAFTVHHNVVICGGGEGGGTCMVYIPWKFKMFNSNCKIMSTDGSSDFQKVILILQNSITIIIL